MFCHILIPIIFLIKLIAKSEMTLMLFFDTMEFLPLDVPSFFCLLTSLQVYFWNVDKQTSYSVAISAFQPAASNAAGNMNISLTKCTVTFPFVENWIHHSSIIHKYSLNIRSFLDLDNQNLTTNEITRYKARLNLHGGEQEYWVNYFDTYAPVITWFAVGLLLVFATAVDFVMTSTGSLWNGCVDGSTSQHT